MHRNGIANISSLDKVADTLGLNIDYSTSSSNKNFQVEIPNGKIANFVCNRRGLYYFCYEEHFGPRQNQCVFEQNIINTEQ